jgi:signal transduction histidine kinase
MPLAAWFRRQADPDPTMRRHRYSGILVALASVAVAFATDAALRPIFGPEPFLMFFCAVTVSAWYGGLLPGVLATVISGGIVEWFIITPFEAIDRPTVVRLAAFLANGVVTSLLVRTLHVARDRAQRSEAALAALNRELDVRVNDRTERLAASVAELEAFSHTIAHTLRAPLRAAEGYADAVRDECGERLDPAAREHLARMSEAVHRMDDLVSDLLEYSRLARQPLTLRAVRLEEVIPRAVEAAQGSGPEHRAPLVRIAPGTPPVCAHASLLARVIAELVTNARVHGHDARVRVVAARSAAGVRVCVEDEGPGIAPEHHGRIFEPFEQLSPDVRRRGTGSGLAIARRAVARMGGSLGVASSPGAGATFWVELPCAHGHAAREAPADARAGDHGTALAAPAHHA